MQSQELSSDQNRRLYGDRSVVKWHACRANLQAAEQVVLDRLRSELCAARMLDVGVGGGRTTVHFAPLVREYTGVDYAPEMVAACQARFAGLPYRFETADARRLTNIPADSKELVLFSHCGIDYVEHDDRAEILRELRRVATPGGWLCFATHNLQRVEELFTPSSLWKRCTSVAHRMRLRAHNPDWRSLSNREYAVINDGAFRFRIRTYHVRPRTQLSALDDAGFGETKVFSATTGREIGVADQAAVSEPWLYYLARKRV